MLKKIGLVCALLVCSSSAQADEILLKNGDRLTGTVLSRSLTRGVTIKTAFADNLHLPWSQISEIKTPPPEKNTSTVASDEPNGLRRFVARNWTGRVNVGANLQDGNTDKSSFSADGELEAKNKRNRYILKAEFNWAEENGQITDNDRSMTGVYDYFFKSKWFLNNSLKLEQDKIEDLELRTQLSIGLGHQVYENKDLNLKYTMGPSYLRDKYENRDADNTFAGLWTLGYDQRFYANAFQLFHDHRFTLPGDDIDAFLFDSKSGIRIPIHDGITATGQIDFDWNNDPATGKTEEDTQYQIKLGYEW